MRKLNRIQTEFQIFNHFIKKYKWKGINYPSKIEDWKRFERNNPTIALNILYVKERGIYRAYISNINWNCEN